MMCSEGEAMSVTSFFIKLVNRRSVNRFLTATWNPLQYQTDTLMRMLRKNENTRYGKRYGFSTIRTIQEYQKQVPVVNYETLKDEMEQIVNGERNIFTAENPIMFAQTSGTTGKPKFIPVTPTCQGKVHQDVMRVWLYHAQRDHPDIFDSKIVSLVSPAIEGYTPAGIPYGSTSGHIYKNIPALIKKSYSIPYSVFEIRDYQAKYYTIMRIALEHDVRCLTTANPSSILKMCEKANEFSEDIIQDIQDGKLSENYEIEPGIRTEVEADLHPNPTRARELQEFRSRRNGKLLPGDYWQNLSLIGCWKGGTVGYYLDRFPDWFNPDGVRNVPVRDWGYLASEVRGSVPLSDEGSAGVLTVASNFFEFVDLEELEASPDDYTRWNFLTAQQLEDGREYYIFITTTAGLYRYDINDVVRVEGRLNHTPQIYFVRKGRGMTNITGEKVSVNQIITSIQQAAQTSGVLVKHFKAEADMENCRYILRVELAHPGDQSSQKHFLQAFDKHLKGSNIEYKSKRESLRLYPPVLHLMREGWYERTKRMQTETGMRQFQAKTELLSPMKQQTMMIKPELISIVEMDEVAQQND
ncbi:MAG: GH3 auxin-responsive promoter family protein [bacterium]|jgi:hypothetical protein